LKRWRGIPKVSSSGNEGKFEAEAGTETRKGCLGWKKLWVDRKESEKNGVARTQSKSRQQAAANRQQATGKRRVGSRQQAAGKRGKIEQGAGSRQQER
jgi:hypothetical protein